MSDAGEILFHLLRFKLKSNCFVCFHSNLTLMLLYPKLNLFATLIIGNNDNVLCFNSAAQQKRN